MVGMVGPARARPNGERSRSYKPLPRQKNVENPTMRDARAPTSPHGHSGVGCFRCSGACAVVHPAPSARLLRRRPSTCDGPSVPCRGGPLRTLTKLPLPLSSLCPSLPKDAESVCRCSSARLSICSPHPDQSLSNWRGQWNFDDFQLCSLFVCDQGPGGQDPSFIVVQRIKF